MANIKKADADKKPVKCMIIPRSQDTYAEKYAVANGKKLPFEVPLVLNEKDIITLEGQKEPFKSDNELNIYDIMEKFSVPQEKATVIMEAQRKHPEIGGSSISWRAKYIIQKI